MTEGLPAIGAVVQDVLISRGLDTDDVIRFSDGSCCYVRKRKREEPVRMVRDRAERVDDREWELGGSG